MFCVSKDSALLQFLGGQHLWWRTFWMQHLILSSSWSSPGLILMTARMLSFSSRIWRVSFWKLVDFLQDFLAEQCDFPWKALVELSVIECSARIVQALLMSNPCKIEVLALQKIKGQMSSEYLIHCTGRRIVFCDAQSVFLTSYWLTALKDVTLDDLESNLSMCFIQSSRASLETLCVSKAFDRSQDYDISCLTPIPRMYFPRYVTSVLAFCSIFVCVMQAAKL